VAVITAYGTIQANSITGAVELGSFFVSIGAKKTAPRRKEFGAVKAEMHAQRRKRTKTTRF
jgi:hypothetical protein